MILCLEFVSNYKPMETVDDSIDPELEVQKLQDLVRKLERQNEILRTKQQQEQNIQNQVQNSQNNQDQLSISDIENVNADKPVTKPKTRFTTGGKDSALAEYNACFYEPSKDELEILDLDDNEDIVLQEESEENWLYQSPKALTPKQKSTSPYKWVREVFDDTPPPELDSVRKCLVYKLDEVTKGGGRLSRSSSSHTLASLNSPISTPSTAIGEAAPAPAPNNNNNNNPGVPQIKQPLIAGLAQNNRRLSFGSIPCTRVNTDTFTRPKKNKDIRRASDFSDYALASPVENNDVSPASSSSSNHGERHDRRQSECLQPPQNKKTLDVHALAKMQEESLRQSFSPMTSPRRSMRTKGGFYLNQPNDSDSNLSPSSQSSTRSSPNRYDADGIPAPRKFSAASHASSTASLNSNGSNDSHGSTPPDSLYGSSQYLETTPQQIIQQQQVPRRSLPNVRGLMNGMRPNASEPQLTSHRDNRPNSPYTNATGRSSPKLRGPSSGRTSPATGSKSPSMLRAPSSGQRAVSPTPKSGLSGIPTPGRTGIPRPGSTTPRGGSGIPMARSSRLERNDTFVVRRTSSAVNRRLPIVTYDEDDDHYDINPKIDSAPRSSLPATALPGRRNYAVRAPDDSWKDGCF
ncbi:SLAIN motif-containing protein 2-like isoform X5 [Lineus longissimus]|uniref:SLAIN motif-containing protein 2-like isoform X5 n=1 Tax=Lineus longissimus TaxID=88925 RepID=UPI00315C7095